MATRGNSLVSVGDNLVFSARHIEGYKHFLRFRIDGSGALSVFVIGIEDPGRGWTTLLRDRDAAPPPHSPPRYVWGTTIAARNGPTS